MGKYSFICFIICIEKAIFASGGKAFKQAEKAF